MLIKETYMERPPVVQASQIKSYDDLTQLPGFICYEVHKEDEGKISPSDPLGQYPVARVRLEADNERGYTYIRAKVGDYIMWKGDTFEVASYEWFNNRYKSVR